MLQLGCIADDVTGATDLATALVSQGFRTVVTLGTPSPGAVFDGADAIVVALKTRTAPVADAVRESRAALAELRRRGAERIYFKYCSTFDSTPTGNIGPVADALLADLGESLTVVVPSFPTAGRTVYRARLFVEDEPLDESPMRHHPLTPMTDSSVPRLLTPQTRHRVATITEPVVRAGAAAVRSALDDLRGESTLVVVDAIDDRDLRTIAAATAELPLVTGGSGLGAALTPTGSIDPARRSIEIVPGRRAVLAGSLSAATRGQIAEAAGSLPTRVLDDLDDGAVTAAVDWAAGVWVQTPELPVLIHSSRTPVAGAGNAVEEALGRIAAGLRELGVTQFIVAGGETSGRVLRTLGVTSLAIGPEIAPGVAWSTAATASGPLDLALKSGNFGAPDMFTAAWSQLDPFAPPIGISPGKHPS